MGQKTHPYGFRLGVTKPWHSRWLAKRDYSRLLHEDLKLKRDLKKQLHHAGVASMEVVRISITDLPRATRPTALLESSAGSIKVKFFRTAVPRGLRQREFEGSYLC